MANLLRPIGMLVMAGALAGLTACSKTVRWEEEVPLNTGETIWVRRVVDYSVIGGAGNPFDLAYRPQRDETTEFNWNGREYRYRGDARIMLLAISPQKEPVLVAKASDNRWASQHDYACTTPFYIQLEPDQSGKLWTWPPRIESWLYDLESNLLLSRHSPDKMKKRYTVQERKAEDYSGTVGTPSQQRVDRTYTGDLCRNKRK